MKNRTGRVVKAVASKFFVDTGGDIRVCFAQKKLRAGGLYVGDYVSVFTDRDADVISAVLPRKNCLIRPYISNVDVCLIVLSPEPEPDFLLADKIIVNCLQQDITPVLALNKCDLSPLPAEEYSGVCEVVNCSALTGEGVSALAELIKGKTACLAGQSAVGKSSLVNALLDCEAMETGELSRRARRGKNTTRRTEILPLGEGTYLADTCGFSMLEAVDIPPEELRLYFDEFERYRGECRFASCTHLEEPDCAVKARVGSEVGEGRYQRYRTIYKELDDRRKSKYD